MFEVPCGEAAWSRALDGARLGFDMVQVSQVQVAVDQFGEAYERRLFTRGERDYAHSGCGVFAERFAARLAAKEAVIKALRLSEAGVAFTDIEVVKLADGDCELALHGRVAQIAREQGACRLLLSMSHDGDYAGAFVSVVFGQPVETAA